MPLGPRLHACNTRAVDRDSTLVNECVATYDEAQHDAALANIDTFFGQVASVRELEAAWRTAGVDRRAPGGR